MSNAHSHDKKHGHEFQNSVTKLGEDVTELKGDVAGLAQDALSTVRAGTTEVQRTIERTLKSGRKSAAQAVEGVSDHIAANPFRSVAIAVGVGFALGAIMCRRK